MLGLKSPVGHVKGLVSTFLRVLDQSFQHTVVFFLKGLYLGLELLSLKCKRLLGLQKSLLIDVSFLFEGFGSVDNILDFRLKQGSFALVLLPKSVERHLAVFCSLLHLLLQLCNCSLFCLTILKTCFKQSWKEPVDTANDIRPYPISLDAIGKLAKDYIQKHLFLPCSLLEVITCRVEAVDMVSEVSFEHIWPFYSKN
jgi:hypothetical protein